MNIQVITMTSKGQIAIPVKMRNELSLNAGDKILAYTYDDTIMLKVLRLPKQSEIEKEMKKAQDWAKEVGLTPEDVERAIKEVRQGKKE